MKYLLMLLLLLLCVVSCRAIKKVDVNVPPVEIVEVIDSSFQEMGPIFVIGQETEEVGVKTEFEAAVDSAMIDVIAHFDRVGWEELEAEDEVH